MLNQLQREVLNKLIEIEKGLPEGVSLTFAADNAMLMMDKPEQANFLRTIHALIMAGYLASHTNRQTGNGVPYWLELTRRGKNYSDVRTA
jgi:hypothetical protein